MPSSRRVKLGQLPTRMTCTRLATADGAGRAAELCSDSDRPSDSPALHVQAAGPSTEQCMAAQPCVMCNPLPQELVLEVDRVLLSPDLTPNTLGPLWRRSRPEDGAAAAVCSQWTGRARG